MILRNIFIVFLVLAFYFEPSFTAEVNLERVELINSSYVEGYYNVSSMRVSKFNRTTFVFSFEAELFVDITDEVTVQVDFYHSPLGNTQYTKSAARIPKDTICKHAEKYYKEWYMQQFKDISNLPQVEPTENVCPVKAVSTQ